MQFNYYEWKYCYIVCSFFLHKQNMYLLGMQLALSHRQANSQCPKDSFYVSIIAILEGGGCCSCPSGFVFRTLGGHRYNSLGISLKITRWLLQFQKHSLVECREKRGNSGKAISEFDFNSQIYSRCS